MEEYAQRLVTWIRNEPEMMELFNIVQKLELPYGFISAGFIRNFVWDTLHGYNNRTPVNDVDVIYFDSDNTEEAKDVMFEKRLSEWDSKVHWQVRNQARMHLRNGHGPYESIEDAMKYWPETATAVGVCILGNGKWEISAPHGLGDLFHLILRTSPYCHSDELFYNRIKEKKWLQQWPKLEIYKEK